MSFNKTRISISIIVFIFIYNCGFSQNINGIILDRNNNDPLIGATIKCGHQGTISNFSGEFTLDSMACDSITIRYIGYNPKTIFAAPNLKVFLSPSFSPLDQVTVTSSKYPVNIAKNTVSIDVMPIKFIANNNPKSIDDVLKKMPGVDVIDGQANIRGGSGFSYGAGSRVLLLIDDIPALQADAGFPNWNDIPIENIHTVEILKGAASALYGSSAMNGIINIKTGYATSKPETKVSITKNLIDSPKQKENAWWNFGDIGHVSLSVLHKQKLGKFDLVLGGFYLNDKKHIKGAYSKYWRGTGNIRYRFADNLSAGLKFNYINSDNQNYFFWQGLEEKYYLGSSENKNKATRYFIDPFINYFDKKGNQHKILSRINFIDNQVSNNRSNKSNLFYGEYQFHRKLKYLNTNLIAGLVFQKSTISSELYSNSDFSIINQSIFIQLEKTFFEKLKLSTGFRYEQNLLTRPEIVAMDTLIGGKQIEAKPVFRLGTNYQLAKHTFLRASIGQAYRFPTIAESFINTNIGLKVVANPKLKSEGGWSTEIGIKQGVKIGNWKGYFDLSGFMMKYNDMIEFTYSPADFFFNIQAQNVGAVTIKGIETTIFGKGKLGKVPIDILVGYTYIDPRFNQFDLKGKDILISDLPNASTGQKNAFASNSDLNIMKYRFEHTVKLDIQTVFNQFEFGISMNYYTKMKALDKFFAGIIPQLNSYLENDYKNIFLLNTRFSYSFLKNYKISLYSDNIFNTVYTMRLGLIEAPRNFGIKASAKF